MMSQESKGKAMPLLWLDPKNRKYFSAGVAFFIPEYGEYLLKVDEEPSEKRYYLRPFASEEDRVFYRVELIMKDKLGKFLRRQVVGEGESRSDCKSNIHINYGSKYKTLVLVQREKTHDDK